ncbi:hypothetical protein C8J57DRAFT_1388503 [Mycena rebaudengoi]|nr:hypothetical protein C8J57DRAFT_1388503 [Mycena rebaudengoi]
MDKTNTGASLVSGIQDISAFLPIIGTEQCEKHVGEALAGGFLYAAATPLSIFGCLGIVKASAAILVASISPRFAQMLADAGFKLPRSVTAIVGTIPHANMHSNVSNGINATANEDSASVKGNGTQRIPTYIAAQRLHQLLKEKHINKSQLQLKFDYYDWNCQLCISTALLSCLSITPYIRLIIEDAPPSKPFPAWAAPLARIAGSAVSVVSQMIIQIQIQRILQMSLYDPMIYECVAIVPRSPCMLTPTVNLRHQ